MTAAPPTTRSRPRADTGALARAAAAGTLTALGGSSILYVGARAADVSLVVTPPGQPTGAVPYVAVLAAVLVSAAAALVAALVLRRLRQGSRWFVAIASLALLGSLVSPLGAAEDTGTALVLGAMHLVVALALIPMLARRLREDEP